MIASYEERRHSVRREADVRNENFKSVLIFAMAMMLVTGIALGYYLGASQAAGLVLNQLEETHDVRSGK